MGRRKEGGVYKRKDREDFGKDKGGSGKEKGWIMGEGWLQCEDGRKRSIGRRRRKKGEGIEG